MVDKAGEEDAMPMHLMGFNSLCGAELWIPDMVRAIGRAIDLIVLNGLYMHPISLNTVVCRFAWRGIRHWECSLGFEQVLWQKCRFSKQKSWIVQQY